MYHCRECKHWNSRNKDDKDLTEEDKIILLNICDNCSQWDEFEDCWILTKFKPKENTK